MHMNDRVKIVLLTTAAVLVWGAVAVMLVISFRPETPAVQGTRRNLNHVPHRIDTLVLSYRDPFLRDVVTEKVSESPRKAEVVNVVHVPDTVPTVDFVFKGTFGSGINMLGVVVRRGEVIMLRIGDRIGDFSVSGFSSERIVLIYKGRKLEVFAK